MKICKKCNEEIEDNFDSCWSCGEVLEIHKESGGKQNIKIKTDEKKQDLVEKLSTKYGSLSLYKSLLKISLIINFVAIIVGIVLSSSYIQDKSLILVFIIVGLLNIFVLTSNIKIVSFLFDLSKRIDN